MVCAGKPATGSDTGTTSACNGDSGGPLVVNGRIVGVVSWGVADCVAKGAYSVFTKVSTYVGAAYPRVDDTNLSFDHKADLWVRNASTKTGYEKDSKGTSFAARQSWGSWSGVTSSCRPTSTGTATRTSCTGVASTGDVYWWRYVPATESWADPKQIFSNWKTRTRIVAPGDVTGDYLPDLLSVDSAGALWIYPGKGNGTFGARTRSARLEPVQLPARPRRLHGRRQDRPDRPRQERHLYLYKGTGKSGTGAFSARVKVRTLEQLDVQRLRRASVTSPATARPTSWPARPAARSTCTRAPARPPARSSPQGSPSAPVSSSTTSSAEIAGERGSPRSRPSRTVPTAARGGHSALCNPFPSFAV